MYEAINSILVSLHKSLYSAREIIFVTGLLYLIVSGFYFQWQRSKGTVSRKKIIRNAILHGALAGSIASYGVALEIQEKYFLDHLLVLLPICTFLGPGLLVLFLWISYYFWSKSKKTDETK
jgi:hypothetical protein